MMFMPRLESFTDSLGRCLVCGGSLRPVGLSLTSGRIEQEA